MKYFLHILILITFFSCSVPAKKNKVIPEQEYIMVDARVNVYENGEKQFSDYKPFKTRTVENLAAYNPNKKQTSISKYGGNMNYKEDATGFFYVKKIEERWWCIDPEGYPYVCIAMNAVAPGRSEGTQKAFEKNYGTKEKWMQETSQLLFENGFNCAGSWSDHEEIIQLNKNSKQQMPYTINLNFMSSYGRKRGGVKQEAGHMGYPKKAIFVFDPEFETFCDEHAKQLAQFKEDPNLFGYFSDNEMPFSSMSLDNFLTLPAEDPGKKAAEEWLKKTGIDQQDITDKYRDQFVAYMLETYASIVSKAITKYDPNHMYIGCRIYYKEKYNEQFMKTAGKYFDIISIHHYNHWTPEADYMANWGNWSGKPFMITEFYTKGEDSGMGNTSGAGWIVRTQKDRGLFYQNFNLALLESKNCVGWHYFRYQDNDPTAKGVDPSNVDSNKGIVSNRFVPWTPMLEKMQELNLQVYNIIEHFDSQKSN